MQCIKDNCYVIEIVWGFREENSISFITAEEHEHISLVLDRKVCLNEGGRGEKTDIYGERLGEKREEEVWRRAYKERCVGVCATSVGVDSLRLR